MSSGYEFEVLLMQKEAREITDNCIKYFRKYVFLLIKDEILQAARIGKNQIVIGDDFAEGLKKHLSLYKPGVFKDIMMDSFPGFTIKIETSPRNSPFIIDNLYDKTTITISW